MATNEALDQILFQLSNLATSVTAPASNTDALNTENENKIKEIMTDYDAINQKEMEERAAIERQRIRNANIIIEQSYCQSVVPALEEEKLTLN